MAFGDSWLISIMMRFTGNGASYMAGLAAQTEALEGKVDRVTLAMNRLNAATTRFAGAFAVAGIAVGAYAVTQAAQLQRTLTAIQNETGADPRKMRGVYQSVFDIANQVGVSPNEAARSWLDISRLTAGQLSVSQMRAIAPYIEQYARTINFNRPDVSVDEATKTGLQLIHLFRAYTPEKIVPLLDQVYRLSGMTAESPSQALRQMTYYEPLFKGVGIDDKTSIAMMSLLDRAGFRNRVGTGVRAAMLESLGPAKLTSHAAQWQMDYLTRMGLFRDGKFAFNTPSGGVDWVGELAQVNKWAMEREKAGAPKSEVANLLFSVFGKQGGNIMELMADPVMIGILQDIRKYQKNPTVSLAAGIRNRDESLGFQAGRAWGNLQAVITDLGYSEVPQLTRSFKALADDLNGVRIWLQHNQGAERGIATGFAWITGVASLRFLLGMLGRLGGLVGITRAAGALKIMDTLLTGGLLSKLFTVGSRFEGIGGAASRLAGPLGVILAIIGDAADDISEFKKFAAQGGMTPWDTFREGLGPLGTVLPRDLPSLHITIFDKTSAGIRSHVRAAGQILTNSNSPGVLNLQSPTLGLTSR